MKLSLCLKSSNSPRISSCITLTSSSRVNWAWFCKLLMMNMTNTWLLRRRIRMISSVRLKTWMTTFWMIILTLKQMLHPLKGPLNMMSQKLVINQVPLNCTCKRQSKSLNTAFRKIIFNPNKKSRRCRRFLNLFVTSSQIWWKEANTMPLRRFMSVILKSWTSMNLEGGVFRKSSVFIADSTFLKVANLRSSRRPWPKLTLVSTWNSAKISRYNCPRQKSKRCIKSQALGTSH